MSELMQLYGMGVMLMAVTLVLLVVVRAFAKVVAGLSDARVPRVEQSSDPIFDLLPVAVFVVRVDDGLIQVANQQAELLSGYHRTELTTMKVEDLVPREFRDRHRTTYRPLYAREPRARPLLTGGKLYLQKKNGSLVEVSIQLQPLMSSRGLLAVAAVMAYSQLTTTQECES